MKIRFTENPPGRPEYTKGAVVEFKGAVEESYARKYLNRGWAEPADEVATQHVADTKRDTKERAAQDAKERGAYKAAVERGDRGPHAQNR